MGKRRKKVVKVEITGGGEPGKTKPGLTQLRDEGKYITGRQIKRANKEAIRLGFSRTLKKIGDLRNGVKCPLLNAWRHVSCDGLVNIRLLIVYWANLDACQSGQPPEYFLLDVTPDFYAGLPVREGGAQ